MKCVICNHEIDKKMYKGKVYWAEGNNAEPVAIGRCCDRCDCLIVIPTRMGLHQQPGIESITIGQTILTNRLNTYKVNNITNEGEEE